MKSNYYLRQNHKKAITYLKSSLYCFKREKQLMYLVIICSSVFCLLGLVFSMLPQIANEPSPAFITLCSNAVNYIGFASGMFLVVQLFIKIFSTRMHVEAVNSIERFDNYVYDLAPNRMIMRPMTEAQLDNNSTKIKSSDSSFNNTYFQSDTDDDSIVVHNNQREIFINEYHLMLYVKSRFFNYLWIGFAVIIFLFALAVNENFFNTLLKIFFPSISIISLIVSSILGYNQSLRFLQNTLTQFESTEKDLTYDRRNELNLRQNQDSLFQYRMSAFTIPMFLIRKYEKSSAKQLRNELTGDYGSIPKTSPFITQEDRTRIDVNKKQNKAAKKSGIKLSQADNFGQRIEPKNEVAATIPTPPAKKDEVKKPSTPKAEPKSEPKADNKKEEGKKPAKTEPKSDNKKTASAKDEPKPTPAKPKQTNAKTKK